MGSSAFGEDLGLCFGIQDAPTTSIVDDVASIELAATLISLNVDKAFQTFSLPREDGVLVGVSLRRTSEIQFWTGEQVHCIKEVPDGAVIFLDMTRDPKVRVARSLDMLLVYLPSASVRRASQRMALPSIKSLKAWNGMPVSDTSLRELGFLLADAVATPSPHGRFYLEQLGRAFLVHTVQHYGTSDPSAMAAAGALAPWQLARARDLLLADLDANIPLENLARECGLSSGHFSRAFRRSTGYAPHRWLLAQRVLAAQAYIEDPAVPLAEVAALCGFADQSHLTRIFKRETGSSPGAWRRAAAMAREARAAESD